MGRKKVKKHQKEPNDSSHSSEDEDNDVISTGKNCPHIVKSVCLNGVKKGLKRGINLGRCSTCHEEEHASNDAETDRDAIWLCLQCGHQGCGRNSDGQHALKHFKVPRSDAHSIATNIATWEVWCYECDNEVNGESNKKLTECINYIRRQAGNSWTNVENENGPLLVNGVHDKTESKENIKKQLPKKNSTSSNSSDSVEGYQRVKGLQNLGNTCFFNAIMQNLTRCHWLSSILEEFCAKSVSITLPAIENWKNEGEDQLDPLPLVLSECGTLTQSLLNFFRDMRSTAHGKGSTLNPGGVLIQICKKAPQFRGTRQQDSHELLRHLIDGIRTEEIRRQKAAILKSFSYGEKFDSKNVSDEMRDKIRAYGRLANHTVIDWLFSGQLISTVLCKECNAASQISEPFLDLSLPVSEEKPLRPATHKRNSIDNDGRNGPLSLKNDPPSRYKEKKMKRKTRKETKKGKGKYSKNQLKETLLMNTFENLADGDEKMQLECKDSEHSDGADIEDNTESESVSINDNGTVEQIIASPTNAISDELCSRLNGIDVNAGDTNSENSESEPSEERFHSRMISARNRLRQEWLTKSLVSLSSRYQPASHECSILSCLNQFTAPELLTGNNKFGCENCTKIRNEKLANKSSDKGDKIDLVYSNASKQLLILSPPAVMTLHLKRFQQVGHTLRKVNRHVEFPLVLDLAPFCSSISVGLPSMEKNQTSVLYSLFGVVEHMGRLASGHYTAFVKTRTVDRVPKKFLNTKAANQFDINKLIDEMVSRSAKTHAKLQASGDGSSTSSDVDELMKSRSGKWYYISDSSVSEVSETSVLMSQAYILFYERIL